MDNYQTGGNLENWYSYTKNCVLSEEYLIYLFQALKKKGLLFQGNLAILSIGANQATYEERLLEFIKSEWKTPCKIYVYDNQVDISQRDSDDFIVLKDEKYEVLGIKFDFILDFRSSLWYASRKFFKKKAINKLMNAYMDLLNSEGMLVVDDARRKRKYTKEDKKIRQEIKRGLTNKKNLREEDRRKGMLLESSTYEKIGKRITKRWKTDKIETKDMIGFIRNEETKEKYSKNEISFICFRS